MKLLSPREQKNEVSAKEIALKKKIIKLTAECDTIIKRINDFKDREEKEKERIQKEHEEFNFNIAGQIKETLAKVKELEARKQEALRPVNESMEAVRVRELIAVARENEVEKREQQFNDTKNSILALAETFREKETEIAKEKEELKTKEKELEARKIHFTSFMRGKEDRIKAELDKLRKLNEQSNK